jgi:cell wall-associated NlpC family hydrolase
MRRRTIMRIALAAIPFVAATPALAVAQGAGVEVGRYFEGTDWTTFRAGLERPLLGPLSVTLYGTHLRAASDTGQRLWGVGGDLALFRDVGQGPYVVGGLGGGFATQSARRLWGSWSAGAGFQVLPFPVLSFAAEARWRELTPGARSGVEVSFRLGAVFGRRASSPPPGTAPSTYSGGAPSTYSGTATPLATAGRLGTAATLADSVVETAAAEMGTAYRLGGTTSEGFDCSGLIKFAYAQHGITLPRTSVEQARAGTPVDRRLEALRVGDILTFSSSGGPVTHVGLYVGDGRFVHSASRGVQLSALSPDDPYGKWWWARWVGARRVVDEGER